MSDVKTDAVLVKELAALLVQELNLEMSPDEITVDMPLYGDGLGNLCINRIRVWCIDF